MSLSRSRESLSLTANAPAVAGGAITAAGAGIWIWRALAGASAGAAIYQTARVNGIRKETEATAEAANAEVLELERAKTTLAEEKARLAEVKTSRAEIETQRAQLESEQAQLDAANPEDIGFLEAYGAWMVVAAIAVLYLRQEWKNRKRKEGN